MQYAGSAWDELKHIRQAIGFLVSIVDEIYLPPLQFMTDEQGKTVTKHHEIYCFLV